MIGEVATNIIDCRLASIQASHVGSLCIIGFYLSKLVLCFPNFPRTTWHPWTLYHLEWSRDSHYLANPEHLLGCQ